MEMKGSRSLHWLATCLFFKLDIPESPIRVVWCVHLGSFPLLGGDTKAFVHHERIFSFPSTVIAKNELCYSHCKEERWPFFAQCHVLEFRTNVRHCKGSSLLCGSVVLWFELPFRSFVSGEGPGCFSHYKELCAFAKGHTPPFFFRCNIWNPESRRDLVHVAQQEWQNQDLNPDLLTSVGKLNLTQLHWGCQRIQLTIRAG